MSDRRVADNVSIERIIAKIDNDFNPDNTDSPDNPEEPEYPDNPESPDDSGRDPVEDKINVFFPHSKIIILSFLKYIDITMIMMIACG